MTADARQVHVLHAFWCRLAGWRRGAREFGGGVDGGVAHYAFEAVVGVLFQEISQALGKPCWRSGLEMLAAILREREDLRERVLVGQEREAAVLPRGRFVLVQRELLMEV